MLVWGDGGVSAFMVPSLCQNEVTPSTMSQPSHLQQALWGKATVTAYLGPWRPPLYPVTALVPARIPCSPRCLDAVMAEKLALTVAASPGHC